MNTKLLAGLIIALPLFTVACSKKEAPAAQDTTAEATSEISAEQQALIDSVDQPDPNAIQVEGEGDVTVDSTAELVEPTPEEVPAAETPVADQPAQ